MNTKLPNTEKQYEKLLRKCKFSEDIIRMYIKSYRDDGFFEEGGDPEVHPLFDAITSKNVSAVKRLLQTGFSARFIYDPYGEAMELTAYVLQDFKGSQDEQILELLLKHGADVNNFALGYRDGDIPFPYDVRFYAIQSGVLNAVRILERYGADMQEYYCDKLATPLSVACHCEHIEIVQYLIETGSNVNALLKDDYTPLLKAVLKGNVLTCRLLVKHGADVSFVDTDGHSILYYAMNTRVKKELLKEILTLLYENGAYFTLKDYIEMSNEFTPKRQVILGLNDSEQRERDRNMIPDNVQPIAPEIDISSDEIPF